MSAQIGKRLREQRKALGYTQAQLASKSGVATRTYIYYETGERDPDSEFLLGAAKAGVDIAYVIGVRGGEVMFDPQLSSAKVEAAVKAVREVEIERLAFLQPTPLWVAVQFVATFGEFAVKGYVATARSKIDELLRARPKRTDVKRRR